jgi:hypothetical protein
MEAPEPPPVQETACFHHGLQEKVKWAAAHQIAMLKT